MKRKLALLLTAALLASSLQVPAVFAAEQPDEVIGESAEEAIEQPEVQPVQTEEPGDQTAGEAVQQSPETAEVDDSKIEAQFEEESVETSAAEDSDIEEPEEEETKEEEVVNAVADEETPVGEPEDVKPTVSMDVICIGKAIVVFNESAEDRYVAAISEATYENEKGKTVSGCLIKSNEYKDIEAESLTDGTTRDLQYSTTYYLVYSTDPEIPVAEANLVTDSYGAYKFTTSASEYVEITAPADAATLQDGALVGLSAQVDKKNNIKLKWKNKTDSKKYKSFSLFRLKTDGTWESLVEKSSKKSFKQDITRFQQYKKGYTDIYKLDCFDESGAADSYATVITPMIYFIESDEMVNSMNFCFTKLCPSTTLTYDMEVSQDKKFTSPAVDSDSCEEVDSIGEYAVSKKVKAEAVRSVFYNEGTSLAEGTTYYCRVRASVSMGSVTVKSAPSATKAVKQGPPMCYNFGIYGWRPDGTEVITDSIMPSVTEGYAVFSGPAPSQVAGYQLLAGDTMYGKYKVVKNIKSDVVQPYNPPQFGEMDSNLFCIPLTSIPPESKYYAVRAVSKTKKALGGFSNGLSEYGKFKKVSGVEVTDVTAVSVTLSFDSQKGIPEYWIYRDTVSNNLVGENAPELTNSQKVGVVKNKFKKSDESSKLKFVDKKKLVDGNTYYYTVRPIYNKKFAAKQKRADQNESDIENFKTFAGYGEGLSDLVAGRPTMENERVGYLKASVANVKEVELKWASVKGAQAYAFFRAPLTSAGTPDEDKAEFVSVIQKGDNGFSSRKIKVEVPEVGKKYIFYVAVGGQQTFSNNVTQSAAIYTYPTNPSKIRAEYGEKGNKGARLKWENPSADKKFASNITYDIYAKDDGGSWYLLDSVKGTKSECLDTDKLNRGRERQYKMVARYTGNGQNVYNQKYTSIVKFCKPYKILVKANGDAITGLTMDAGTTYTLKVYFYDRDGDTGYVTDKKLTRIETSNSGVCSISSTGTSDDYVTIKLNANAKGRTTLTVGARDYNDDDSRLLKTVTINVR